MLVPLRISLRLMQRGSDARAGRLALSLNFLVVRDGGSVGLRTHALRDTKASPDPCIRPERRPRETAGFELRPDRDRERSLRR
jgi:hypothetical protein